MSLLERDGRVIWHPATHLSDRDFLPPIPIARAHGAWLIDTDDRAILDAIGSWWTCVHGHAHPRLVEAVRDQVARLDHVMFAGFTHEPAVALAERLLALAPPGLGKVFFSDCGSAAVEVALKLSFQSRMNRGQERRRRLATLDNGYHGETLGALSLGSRTWREPFGPLCFDPIVLPAPALAGHAHADLARDAGADAPETEQALARLREHADELTAVVVEPIVQCAGRMTMTGAGFYRRLAAEAQQLGIHVIADEIAVGFGRTGRLFASEWSGVTPDLMCVSKALSGGFLPLAATLIRAGFEDDFAGDPARSFLHSHTYTANPIACAAALAGLDLFTEHAGPGGLAAGLGPGVERIIARIEVLRHELADRCPAVLEHRQAGTIAALRVGPRSRGPATGRSSLHLRRAALARGVLLRPLHDTIYWMPPMCIDDDELSLLARATGDAIEEVFG